MLIFYAVISKTRSRILSLTIYGQMLWMGDACRLFPPEEGNLMHSTCKRRLSNDCTSAECNHTRTLLLKPSSVFDRCSGKEKRPECAYSTSSALLWDLADIWNASLILRTELSFTGHKKDVCIPRLAFFIAAHLGEHPMVRFCANLSKLSNQVEDILMRRI